MLEWPVAGQHTLNPQSVLLILLPDQSFFARIPGSGKSFLFAQLDKELGRERCALSEGSHVISSSANQSYISATR